MAFITVPTKTFDDSLSADEFNQILGALKDASYDINTKQLVATGASITGNLSVSGTATIGGETGPFAKYYEHASIVYIAKDGGTYDGVNFDGKSPGKALGSFQDAIDNAATILGSAPSENNRLAIVCLDGATYEESITCADFVDIYAPNAFLKLGNTGDHKLVLAQNKCVFAKIYRETGTGAMITNNANSSSNRLEVGAVQDATPNIAVLNINSSVLYLNIQRLIVSGGGKGYAESTTSSKHVHFNIHTVSLDSNNAVGFHLTQAGDAHGFIDGFYKTSAGFTGTKAILIDAGSLDIFVNELTGDNAYTQTGTAKLNVYANNISGTVVAATPSNVSVITPTYISSQLQTIALKENSLGNPVTSGYILSSTSSGVRSWIPIPGNMLKSVYDPTNKQVDVFKHENHTGDYIDFTNVSPVSVQGKRISWNETDNTLDIHTGIDGTVIQVGQETIVKVYNPNAYPIQNGKAVKSLGTATNGFPNIDYILPDNFDDALKPIGVSTDVIEAGTYGFVTLRGKVRGIDTSSLTLGPVYASSTIAGNLTSTKPLYPNYAIRVGTTYVVDATEGVIYVNIKGDAYDTIVNYWNGSLREEFDFLISSNGTTITGSLERSGGGDLTGIFDTGLYNFDCTPAMTVSLTAGTSTVPAKNYVYIPTSTKVLTVSTTGWPSEQHIKIADTVLQSASMVQTYGPLQLRNWNDSIQNTINMGENAHIGEWIRARPAAWESGCFGTMIVSSPTTVYFSNTSGYVYQKHLHSFGAFNTASGDLIRVLNHPVTPYLGITNIASITTDSTGTTIPSANFFNVVVWGINNREGVTDKIMLNLPNGSYTTLANAIADTSKYDVYTIPQAYRGCGFLIGRYTFQRVSSPSVAWTLHQSLDLRGLIFSDAGGGIGITGVTDFLALTDAPDSYSGKAYDVVRVNGSETALEFVNGVSGSFTTTDGKTVTVQYGVITSIV